MANKKTAVRQQENSAMQHPWCQRLLTPLADHTTACPVADDDPLWERIEAQMVRLGSLSHSQVDLNQVAEQCLTLLEQKTKDMRVLAHLLHCLQQQATPALFITALSLIESWLSTYWTTAAPRNHLKKQRIMAQIISRFERNLPRVAKNARAADLAYLLQQTQQLQHIWQPLAADQQDLTGLLSALQRLQQPSAQAAAPSPPPGDQQQPPDHGSTFVLPGQSRTMPLQPDTSDERRWKQTLLNVAQLITESHPASSTGYRLRRHAIWSAITTVPAARNGTTELAVVSADRISDYQQALAQGDNDVWQQIEHSLTLVPYWFDGHRLSAQAATQQGYTQAAAAIREELTLFLQRLPALKTLNFSDGTAFLPADCAAWLHEKPAVTDNSMPAWGAEQLNDCYKRDGLHAALNLLNQHTLSACSPRQRFYQQMALADLLHSAGITQLAQQHYLYLWQETCRLALDQWEPDMTEHLRQRIRHGEIPGKTG